MAAQLGNRSFHFYNYAEVAEKAKELADIEEKREAKQVAVTPTLPAVAELQNSDGKC